MLVCTESPERLCLLLCVMPCTCAHFAKMVSSATAAPLVISERCSASGCIWEQKVLLRGHLHMRWAYQQTTCKQNIQPTQRVCRTPAPFAVCQRVERDWHGLICATAHTQRCVTPVHTLPQKRLVWGGVVARCAHGSMFLECSPSFYPVEQPPQNHTQGPNFCTLQPLLAYQELLFVVLMLVTGPRVLISAPCSSC